jgi:2-oxo-4-hydroxy-4-carboxy-5-ureidoimidazoline decarboxylase
MTPAELDALSEAAATEVLRRCCGASRWVAAMVAARPFRSVEGLFLAADGAWELCSPTDWLEAFAHHPRIGDIEGLRRKFADTAAWAAGEQAGAAQADEATLAALAAGNATYEARFGHIFIVCATGKRADEMLTMLNARVANEPEAEARIAAAEQHKITRIRLEKLLA